DAVGLLSTTVFDTIDVDTTHPVVVHTFPFDGQGDVEIDVTIEIRFSEDMDMDTVMDALVVYSGEEMVDGQFVASPVDHRLEFTPEDGLIRGTSYRIVIGTDARDANGLNLVEPYEFAFDTEPIVTSTSDDDSEPFIPLTPDDDWMLPFLLVALIFIAALIVVLRRRQRPRTPSEDEV
ncbi:MAG: Ig-like domain-containing protein, partial [Thermoplasmata archaeon]|nr:Ig-like domain-containing protein [Thermoplasmata archaeon]